MLVVGLLAMTSTRYTMKHLITALGLCFSLLNLFVSTGQAASRPQLPAVIWSDLSRRFPGWQPALPDAHVSDFWARERQLAPLDLAIASGDFNCDGKLDWAVHFVTARAERRLMVYLRRGKGYRYRTLDRGTPSGQRYIVIEPRGTRAISLSTDRPFLYRCDSIGLHIFEKGGSSFIYESGRFRQVITGD